MRQGSCLIGACSPVLISCSIRSDFPKSELFIANMPSHSSISRENCLFCYSESPSEFGWITFALLFSLSVLSCLSSPIFLSITEQYGWLGADGMRPISVGVALPFTPLTGWYSATGRTDHNLTTLSVLPLALLGNEQYLSQKSPVVLLTPPGFQGLRNSVHNLLLI